MDRQQIPMCLQLTSPNHLMTKWSPDEISVIIDRVTSRSREIMHLVVSVHPSVCPCVCPFACEPFVCLSVISWARADNLADAVDRLLIVTIFDINGKSLEIF